IELEWRRHRGVEHLEPMAEDLDLAAGQVGVLGPGGPPPHQAIDLDAELVAQALGDLEHLGAIRVADDLGESPASGQVAEGYPAVVATPMDPSAQGDGLVKVFGRHFAGVARAHRLDTPSVLRRPRPCVWRVTQWPPGPAGAAGTATPASAAARSRID